MEHYWGTYGYQRISTRVRKKPGMCRRESNLPHRGANRPSTSGQLRARASWNPDSFANTGDDTARFLDLFSPGGMERYFEERAAMRRDVRLSGPDMTMLIALG
jgi:hypothetical protein